MELGAICEGPPRFRCASRGSRRLGFDPREPRSAAAGTVKAGARAFLQRKSSVLVRLVLFCLGLLKTPPKVVKTAFTIDSSGNRRI